MIPDYLLLEHAKRHAQSNINGIFTVRSTQCGVIGKTYLNLSADSAPLGLKALLRVTRETIEHQNLGTYYYNVPSFWLQWKREVGFMRLNEAE